MKTSILAVAVIATASSATFVRAQEKPGAARDCEPAVTVAPAAADSKPATPRTPAQERMAWAEATLNTKPGHAPALNALALAYARRARETGDPSWYAKAQDTLAEVLKGAPRDYEARRNRVWILLGQHEFAEALVAAKNLLAECPDDLMVYAFLTDANVELGRYEEAEKACQWMLDMRPGNVPGLTRAAYLREIFGMVPGAIALLHEAFDQLPAAESEDRAWVAVQIAHLELMRGEVDAAQAAVTCALELFPDYHYALAQQGEIHGARGDTEREIEVLRRHYALAPHPENLGRLAQALERGGNAEEARAAFERFEREAVAESDGPDNANRELIFHFVDHVQDAERALRLAREEVARRQDIGTLHALAWALHASGEHDEAAKRIEAALAPGFRKARVLFHAGTIHAAAGNPALAKRRLEECLALKPPKALAAEARERLAKLPAE